MMDGLGSVSAGAAFPDADASSDVAASMRFESASFEELVQAAERIGSNRGRPPVIELYRNWIAVQSGGARHLYAAWFNLGVELSRAGEPRNAILAHRTALALKPDFYQAAINLGLLLEQLGQTEAALQSWAQALQPDEPRIALINNRARLLEQIGRLEE